MPQRRVHRADLSQAAIVAALRQNGISVKVLSAVGGGFPDLCVAFRGGTYLLETKSDNRVSHGTVAERRTPAQIEFHAKWAGDIGICDTAESAVDFVCRMAKSEGRL